MMQELLHLALVGASLVGIKYAVGGAIDRTAINYLGQRNGEVAKIFVYVGAFFFLSGRLSGVERNDVNYLINPREMSGEIWMNTCLHMFPSKVNLELYRQIMLEKQHLQMLRMNQINQVMGVNDG